MLGAPRAARLLSNSEPNDRSEFVDSAPRVPVAANYWVREGPDEDSVVGETRLCACDANSLQVGHWFARDRGRAMQWRKSGPMNESPHSGQMDGTLIGLLCGVKVSNGQQQP